MISPVNITGATAHNAPAVPHIPNITCRFTENGPVQTLVGVKLLAVDTDDSMLVWSTKVGSTKERSIAVRLVRDNVVIEPPLPSQGSPAFVAPGVMCQFTELGLQLTSLKKPNSPTIYNLDIPFNLANIEYSPRGFAAVSIPGKPPSPNLFFFPLKKP